MFDRSLLTLPGAKLALALLALCALVQAGTIIGQSLALAAALSGIWVGAALDSQAGAIVTFICCYAARQVLILVRDMLLDRFARTRAAELRDRMLHAIFCESASLAARIGSPVLADAAIQGVDQVESYIRVILPKMAGLMGITMPVFVCVFVLDWVSGVILLVLFPVAVMFMVLIGRSARARAERQYESYQVLSNHFIDTLRGMRTLRVFGVAKRYADVVYAVSERFRKATMRTLGVATLSSAVLDLIATCGVAAVSIMLGFRLLDGTLALFTGLAVLILSPEYFRPIREFASDFHASLDGKNAMAAIRRIVGETNALPDEPDGPKDSAAMEGMSAAAGDASAAEPAAAPAKWTGASHLSLADVTFAYEDAADPALRGISLELHGFERVAVIGPSGSGKSTLIDVLGGFKVPDGGAIEWDGRPLASLDEAFWQNQVIYIPQHPYIFHATLRDNIAFYRPDASPELIEQAVQAMGLGTLVAKLPRGLDTVIGEGGRGLSGGQAQRIALARAFLDPDRRILLFDEPTAHLDIETEWELKQRMLPLMEGRLVVFATHRMHWAADMDRVIRIENGAVVDASTGWQRAGVSADAAIAAGLENAAAVDAADADAAAAAVGAAAEKADGASSPGAHDGRPSRRWVGAYVRGNGKLLVGACVLGVLAFVCAAMLMFSAGYLIGYTAQPDALLIAIMAPMAFVQLFGIGRPVARYAQRLVSHDWVFRATSDLRRRLYAAAERRSSELRFAGAQGEKTSGEYLELLSEDIGRVQNLFLRVAMPIAIAIALIVLITAVCVFLDVAFAGIVLFVLVAAALLVPLAATRASRTSAARAKRLIASLYDRLTDNVMGSSDWVFSGRGAQFCRSNAREEAQLRAQQAHVRNCQRFAHLAISLLFAVLACIAMAWAAGHFGGGPGMGGNLAIAFTLVVFPLVEAFAGLPEAMQSAEGYLDSLDRLQAAGAADEPVAGADAVAAPAEKRRPAACDPAADAAPQLAFQDVAFAYDGASDAVLADVTLSIPQGQKVAILGRSGAGKSTLLSLARGDMPPANGTVQVEGVPPTQLDDVSRHVAVVEQDAYLFNQTLRQNVVLGRLGITDDDVRIALGRVGLGPLLEELPRGLDTLMGEAGARFSGGERQRIALARVLLSPAPLVLFDEPAVGLDPLTERALFDAVFDALADRTLVVVTHHLQEADRFDRIVFVEDGRVALDGAPSDLERESPRYRQLLAFDRG